MAKRSFTTKDTAVNTGTGYSSVRDWTIHEYIIPEVESGGQGKPNFYSEQNLYQIKLFSILLEHGVPRGTAKNIIAEFVTKVLPKPFLCIFKDGKLIKTRWMTSGQLKNEDLDRVTVINVEKVINEVDNNIINLS